MKKFGLFLFFSLSLTLFGCGSSEHCNSIEDGTWVKYYNGNKIYEGNYFNCQKDGVWTGYYENGTIKSVEHYLNGIPNGRFLYYHENGNLKQEIGVYKNGKKHGSEILYDENLNVTNINKYNNGTLVDSQDL